MDVQNIKQRFGILGNSAGLNRALSVAIQVAPTDMSVLITGESGTGKEVIPKLIHQLSSRKHGQYIAVNCGAIPEGTIDSELFGHEKGSFTGAHDQRKGYFEVADQGTIFLDEVAELPHPTQVRLLRVLETGEYIRVGSSKIMKTNVRVVAATNENMLKAVQSGKFREDLYYRLSTVPIQLPALRNRSEDIHLLFRKFAVDFSEKYRMPAIRLTEAAVNMLTHYAWPGNIRQLKNITEQISVIESEREITPEILGNYLTDYSNSTLPAIAKTGDGFSDLNERDLLYKVLFDMRKDLTDLKKIVLELLQHGSAETLAGDEKRQLIDKLYRDITPQVESIVPEPIRVEKASPHFGSSDYNQDYEVHAEVEESLSLEDREKELIKKALEKHRGKRKYAAQDLGISERTLYRKIKEYNL
ncbi:MAG: sigma-54-dependent Fis family transcriptional regulator [Crocinitomicaceae bacterium]|nr:sigma-54-dependent Fis family transcriptional regulator [Crocinitomicaceae bacterium]MBK8924308.1 sigma-54-dependent Fis family transcriptional regulator [Crocinitomicaceae bacterium]